MAKNKKIDVQGTSVSLFTDDRKDFISLTDIARYRDTQRGAIIFCKTGCEIGVQLNSSLPLVCN